jgi:hypothetical protein
MSSCYDTTTVKEQCVQQMRLVLSHGKQRQREPQDATSGLSRANPQLPSAMGISIGLASCVLLLPWWGSLTAREYTLTRKLLNKIVSMMLTSTNEMHIRPTQTLCSVSNWCGDLSLNTFEAVTQRVRCQQRAHKCPHALPLHHCIQARSPAAPGHNAIMIWWAYHTSPWCHDPW